MSRNISQFAALLGQLSAGPQGPLLFNRLNSEYFKTIEHKAELDDMSNNSNMMSEQDRLRNIINILKTENNDYRTQLEILKARLKAIEAICDENEDDIDDEEATDQNQPITRAKSVIDDVLSQPSDIGQATVQNTEASHEVTEENIMSFDEDEPILAGHITKLTEQDATTTTPPPNLVTQDQHKTIRLAKISLNVPPQPDNPNHTFLWATSAIGALSVVLSACHNITNENKLGNLQMSETDLQTALTILLQGVNNLCSELSDRTLDRQTSAVHSELKDVLTEPTVELHFIQIPSSPGTDLLDDCILALPMNEVNNIPITQYKEQIQHLTQKIIDENKSSSLIGNMVEGGKSYLMPLCVFGVLSIPLTVFAMVYSKL